MTSAEEFEQRQLIHHADIFTRAESQYARVEKMPILHAQHVGSGGNRRIKNGVIIGIQEHHRKTRLRLDYARDRAQEKIHVRVDLVSAQAEQRLHARGGGQWGWIQSRRRIIPGRFRTAPLRSQ